MRITGVEVEVREVPVKHVFRWRAGLPGSGTTRIESRVEIQTDEGVTGVAYGARGSDHRRPVRTAAARDARRPGSAAERGPLGAGLGDRPDRGAADLRPRPGRHRPVGPDRQDRRSAAIQGHRRLSATGSPPTPPPSPSRRPKSSSTAPTSAWRTGSRRSSCTHGATTARTRNSARTCATCRRRDRSDVRRLRRVRLRRSPLRGQALEEAGYLWYEEPMREFNIEAHRRLTDG